MCTYRMEEHIIQPYYKYSAIDTRGNNNLYPFNVMELLLLYICHCLFCFSYDQMKLKQWTLLRAQRWGVLLILMKLLLAP